MRLAWWLGLGLWMISSVGWAAVPWLQIKVYGVGEGEAILVQTPTGKTALLETGGEGGEGDLFLNLRQDKVAQIDTLIFSHLEGPVFGGLGRIVRGWKIGDVVGPGFPVKSKGWKKAQALLQGKSLSIRAVERGQTLEIDDGVRLKILWPKTPFLRRGYAVHSNSLILRLEYEGLRVLFLGAASPDAEAALLKEGEDLKSHVVMLAHPTKAGSFSNPLLEALQPKLILAGCSGKIKGPCPHPALLRRLQSVKVVSTKTEGTLQLLSDGQHLWLSAKPQGLPDILQVLPLTPDADKPEPTPPASPQAGRPSEPIPPDLEKSRSPTRPFALPEKPGWLDLKAQGKTVILPPPFPSKHGYTASKKSRFFHRASCRFAKTIPPQERVSYTRRTDALRRLRPASDCLP